MTWTSPISLILPPDHVFAEGGLTVAATLNSTNTKLTWVFKAKQSADIVSVFFRVATVTTSQSLTVSIQSVTTTSVPSRPSGTILGATANGQAVVGTIAATTTYEATLNETVAMTKGVMYAVVIEWTSTAGVATLPVQANTNWQTLGRSGIYVGRATYTSGAWGSVTSLTSGMAFTLGVRTNASNWWMPEFCLPSNTNVVTSGYHVNSPTDEYGNKIYLPSGTVNALWVASDQDGTGTINLYDTNDNVVASASITPNERQLNNYGTCLHPVTSTSISEGWYRVTLKPDTTSTVTRFTATYAANALNGRAMAANCILTSRADNGAWTDDSNSMMSCGVEMEPSIGGAASGSLINSQQLVRQGWM